MIERFEKEEKHDKYFNNPTISPLSPDANISSLTSTSASTLYSDTVGIFHLMLLIVQ